MLQHTTTSIAISSNKAVAFELATPHQLARQEIDSLRRSLILPDSYQIASEKVQETAFSKSGSTDKGSDAVKGNESADEVKRNHGKSKFDKKESSRKGHSDKEKHSKIYGEQAGKNQRTKSKSGREGNHQFSHEEEKGGFFKDKLLHKSGNYEKGYRDKYHLDEMSKHDKFWKNHHSLDKYRKYGKTGSHFHKVQRKKEKKSDKKELEKENEDGKKGESGGERSSSEHKGHQSQSGKETHYKNIEEHHKKKP